MSQVTVTLPDGSTRSVPQGTSVLNVAADISPRLAKAALAIVINDQMVDLSYIIENDVELRVVTIESPEALELYPVHLTGVRRLPEAFPTLTEGLLGPAGITNFIWPDTSCEYDIPSPGTLKGYQIPLDYLLAKARR